ncbi:MAG: exonuclease domain-containing protein [Planctomycetes bacterium]|nr:exonuclease domain-containing protein [Planctomycetota bacterium]
MKKLFDEIIVLDLECTCWDGAPPPGQGQEIIEIGLCMLRLDTLEEAEFRSILVRPENSSVSEFCTQLTSLTQEQVDGGISFREACRVLKKEFLSKERTWASWGAFDRRQFERQCSATGCGYPFGPTHLNAKNLFTLAHGLRDELGMDAALRHLRLELVGHHHRGVDDARNIAKILADTLRRAR